MVLIPLLYHVSATKLKRLKQAEMLGIRSPDIDHVRDSTYPQPWQVCSLISRIFRVT